MAQAPKLILNTDGMPWGRWVQQTVQGHDTDITSLKQTVASGAAVQNSQLKQIAGQIATLASQQAQLTSVVSHLASLGAASSNGTSGYGLSTTFTAVTSTTIAIPSGSTRAVVIGNVSAEAINSGGSNDSFFIRSYVSGPGGQFTYNTTGRLPFGNGSVIPDSAGNLSSISQSSITTSGVFTGLSGGTLTFSCMIATAIGAAAAYGGNVATVQGTAIFLP